MSYQMTEGEVTVSVLCDLPWLDYAEVMYWVGDEYHGKTSVKVSKGWGGRYFDIEGERFYLD